MREYKICHVCTREREDVVPDKLNNIVHVFIYALSEKARTMLHPSCAVVAEQVRQRS